MSQSSCLNRQSYYHVQPAYGEHKQLFYQPNNDSKINGDRLLFTFHSPLFTSPMTPTDQFEQFRPKLFGIAYRMLGSIMEAEDMVQETFLRWNTTAHAAIQTPNAYLTTIITRLCLDKLKSAQVQREQYIGEWLPEPLITTDSPDQIVELADSLSLAFLHLLERLTPAERAVLLLREVFEYDYGSIAAIVQKSEANCRQLLRRARQRVADDRPRFDTDSAEQQMILMQFGMACTNGDLDGLLQLLAPDAVEISDGGGRVPAARRPIVGANKVARLMLGLMKQAPADFSFKMATINSEFGMIGYTQGQPYVAMSFHIEGGKISHIFSIVNPDKLAHLQTEGD